MYEPCRLYAVDDASHGICPKRSVFVYRGDVSHLCFDRQFTRSLSECVCDIFARERALKVHPADTVGDTAEVIYCVQDVVGGLFFALKGGVRIHEMACVEHDACRVAVYPSEKLLCFAFVGEGHPRPPEIFEQDGDIVRYEVCHTVEQLCRRFEHVLVGVVKVARVDLIGVGFGYVPDELFGLVAERATDTAANAFYPFFAGVCSEIGASLFARSELLHKSRFVIMPKGYPMR